MPVDHSRAWEALAAEMVDRQGIGRDALFALMKRLEVEHSFEEEQVTLNLRRWGVLFSEDLRRAARDEEVNQSGDGPSGDRKAVPSVSKDAVPEHPQNQEVHDVGVHGGTGASAQRGSAGHARVAA